MKMELVIESLKQCTDGHDKGYQLMMLKIDGVNAGLLRVYGPLKAPQQVDLSLGTEAELDKQWLMLLKKKLKHYVRVNPKSVHSMNCKPEEVMLAGANWARELIYKTGIWRSRSPELNQKFFNRLKAVAGHINLSEHFDEVDVEDVFRTEEQRKKARLQQIQAQREIDQLSDWGAF